MSTWITHLTAFYKEKKRTNPNYKYKDAMKDARSTYVSTVDHSPKSDCHQRKLTDCKKRSKCLVTKLGKLKSYCRTKRNAGPLTASNTPSSGSQKSLHQLFSVKIHTFSIIFIVIGINTLILA